jgi:arylsulfatase A-like enzyme
VRRYDGEIIGTDTQVGRLVDALDQSAQLQSTLVVVTADHGESLGEDNYYFQHGEVLNEASLRIPLVLRHPGLPAGMRIVAGVDLGPLVHGTPLPNRDLVAYTVIRPEVVAIRRDG